jgi:hypothetical protein
MAINAIDYALWRTMAAKKVLAAKPDVLEIGEANWYSDVPLDHLADDIPKFAVPELAASLLETLRQIRAQDPDRYLFDIAKIFYKTFLDYQSITAIDQHGTSAALKFDLNEAVPIAKRFHITINNGTAEHIFNRYQVFKTIHERTLPGGVMLHALPFGGYLDHGFYNYNPTLIVDLAASNDYRILQWLYGELTPLRILSLSHMEQVHEMARHGELGPNSFHYAVFQKAHEDRAFAVPMQGFYAGKLSATAQEDWRILR